MKQPDLFAGRLLAFYDEHARDLPFRVNPRPYHTWISEIMLQQTRMDTVIPYFNRFIAELPDVAALAAAEEERLLKLWEGLGYYSRVRNLQKAAQVIVRDFAGTMPGRFEDLVALPGIGPYTAGAIASIAFGQPVPAVDGNVIRVFSRLEAYGEPVMNAKGKKAIFQAVSAVISRERPGDFNQAVMELGATVCLPNGAPLCQRCPVSDHCLAFAQGNPLDYPVLPEKKARRQEEHTVLLIIKNGEFLIERRADEGLLAGLWQFPMRPGFLDEPAVTEWIRSLGIADFWVEPSIQAKHIFSHVEWHMQAYLVVIAPAVREDWSSRLAERDDPALSGPRWVRGEDLDAITLPTAFRSFREVLARHLSR